MDFKKYKEQLLYSVGLEVDEDEVENLVNKAYKFGLKEGLKQKQEIFPFCIKDGEEKLRSCILVTNDINLQGKSREWGLYKGNELIELIRSKRLDKLICMVYTYVTNEDFKYEVKFYIPKENG